jgi:hypothetical protein
MGAASVPECVARLLWDVDPESIDPAGDRDYVMERVMSRGTWEAMRWLRATYTVHEMADFLRRRGTRLSPRDRAYWSSIAGLPRIQDTGGGRPPWLGGQSR